MPQKVSLQYFDRLFVYSVAFSFVVILAGALTLLGSLSCQGSDCLFYVFFTGFITLLSAASIILALIARKLTSWSDDRKVFSCSFGLVIGAYLVWLVATGVRAVEQSQAKNYCETFIPLLEQHRLQYGSYPDQLPNHWYDKSSIPKASRSNSSNFIYNICGYAHDQYEDTFRMGVTDLSLDCGEFDFSFPKKKWVATKGWCS